MKRKNIAVILAGGKGERFDTTLPKQFAKIAGKSVIEHTIDIFEKHEKIDEIVIVMNKDFINKMEEIILKNNWTKLKKVLQGGKERYHSSLAAINAYKGEFVNLIFHDAVRPLLERRIISEIIESLENYDAVDVAIPATDTIIKVNTDNMCIENIPQRKQMYQGQTPQAFKSEIITKAYEIALQDPDFVTTDDCGVIKKYMPEKAIFVVNGSPKNIKLTHIEDLHFADKLYQLNSNEVMKHLKYDDLENKVLVVFGGNSGIGKAIVDIARKNKAKVYSFSRTTTNTNITEISDIQQALKDVINKETQIDFIINSAAVLRKEAFHSMQISDMYEIIDINYKGMVNVSYCAYEYLKKSHGQLLHFTSSSYTLGRPFYSLYSSSKAAVVNFVQALAQEWSSSNIRVNCINPERTLTEMRVKNFGKEDPKTLLSAEDVARSSITTLLSPCSGQVIDVRIRK